MDGLERQVAGPRGTATADTGFLNAVYSFMAMGLGITAVVAWFTAHSEAMLQIIYGQPFVLIGLFIAQLGLVAVISGMVMRLSFMAVASLFVLYSALTGVTISGILLAYTTSSIAGTFFVAAGTFGAMTIVGLTTKKDLTKLGGILFMALIGVIIASVVNMFLKSPAMEFALSILGVLVFTGLTAYDTQKLKQIHDSGLARGQEGGSLAVRGALALYLDFINLFLFLLRLLGNRR